ncbi:Ig-like domain-containing protein, partial [Aliivibrio fischeri]|uniref:Ig-like domain-containing protein n=1 Tax=Aliivibrio fischeri TaxID=668 RepID=UPI000B089BAE
AKLEKIAIFPINAFGVMNDRVMAPVGKKTHLMAIGTLSDHTTLKLNSSVTWKSEDEQIAIVSNQGEITPKKMGKINITATKDGISETLKFEVIHAKIAKIMIEPDNKIETPLGREIELTVSGILTDGRKVGNLATHIRLLPTNAATMRYEIGKPPVLVPVTPGEATVTATVDGHIATSSITITPEVLERIIITPEKPSVPLYGTIQLTAKGVFSNSNEPKDITNVAWDTTSRFGIVALDNKGKVTLLKDGDTNIIATKNSIQSTVTITSEDKLASISFPKKGYYIEKGKSGKPLEVIGTTQSGKQILLPNSSLKFHSNDSKVASVINGRITNPRQGSVTITAIYELWSDKGRKLLRAQMRFTCIEHVYSVTCRIPKPSR